MNYKYIIGGSLSLVATSMLAQAKSPDADIRKMNVLFILADDLRPNLGCYSDPYAITPNIDNIAANGVTFGNAYCQQAVSNPSRASMLTGLRPDQTGVTNLYTNFRTAFPDVVTLPQFFKNNGYYVAGVGKIFHSVAHDIDTISFTEVSPLERRGYLLPQNSGRKGAKQSAYEDADVEDNKYPDGEIADNAVQMIKNASESPSPFFLAVGFLKPHLPFNAPRKYWDMYKDCKFEVKHRERPEGSPDIAFHSWNELRGYTDMPATGSLGADKEQELWRGYYACISYVDAQIGKLLDALDEYGLRDNTVIVVWGDHGYHLGEQDLWCKSTNFELDTRTPLIISVPAGEIKGAYSRSIVESVDIYPTLVDYCGFDIDKTLAGASLRPVMNKNGESEKFNYAFSQFVRPYNAILKNTPATHMGYSVRTPQWRFTCWYNLDTGDISEKELYLMNEDGIESKNLTGDAQYTDVEKELLECVNNYKNGVINKSINRKIQ